MKYFLTSLLILSALSLRITAQTVNENSGWLFLTNSTKFSDKWGMHVDIQVRSHDEWDGVKNLLLRPGIVYHFNENSNFTLGYLLNQTFTKLIGTSDNQLTEHRIWEQYILNHKINKINVSHRFRLEQRFLERRSSEDLFSQRLRYFFRFMLPVANRQTSFEKGPFVALQNEVFVHLQNKDQLNGYFFDQNRAYVAAGYRFTKKVDIEVGYMNQASKGATDNTVNNIIQLALYTRF